LNSMELHLKPTDIIPLLKEAKTYTKDLFPSKSINMKIRTNDESCRVMAEPILEELFFNLIHNGVKFQKTDNAKIKIDIVSSPDLGLVRIDFSDHGPGIPADLKGAIFERFVKAGRSSQSGIGLSLVKALSERYNGKVKVLDRVKNKPEKGTTIRVYLPLAE
jgi:signal transduction histidine kinase